MRSLLYTGQSLFLGLCILSISILLLQVSGGGDRLSVLNNKQAVYNGIEDYDASLNRLNTLKKIETYCDSLYTATMSSTLATNEEKNYVDLVNSVIRKRFYHGYSYYGMDNNYLAYIFSKVTNKGYGAIVIPNDILKFPNASCSQQSIIMMEVLQAKGFKTRNIGFLGKKYGGHYCFEVFFKGNWHFYDPNLEPDATVMNAYGRPGIAFLAKHPEILVAAYKNKSTEELMDIFPTYWYGPVNKFSATKAIIFQKFTKVLSYTIWIVFFAAFLYVRRLYRRLIAKQHVWNSRIYFPQTQPGTASSYYPGLTAPGA